ncbi:hypothetical protein [Pelobium manganitolerans]|uniref:hypothetical protein n=1 Tax=Pelobium manganitolerans TaxID=1842495 RepID=UPI003FA3D06C
MAKSPMEKQNELKEELEENVPVKKTDFGAESGVEGIPEKKGSYSETLAEKSRTNRGPIGIDRDPGDV